jgi:hypothetical protein
MDRPTCNGRVLAMALVPAGRNSSQRYAQNAPNCETSAPLGTKLKIPSCSQTFEIPYPALPCTWRFESKNHLKTGGFSMQGNPKPLKRRVHRKKTGFYPKTRFFWISQFSISALSHKVLPLMLKNVVISMLPVVLCRAGLETLLGNYSYISNACPATFFRRKCSDKQCHTMSIFAYQEDTQQLELCIRK